MGQVIEITNTLHPRDVIVQRRQRAMRLNLPSADLLSQVTRVAPLGRSRLAGTASYAQGWLCD